MTGGSVLHNRPAALDLFTGNGGMAKGMEAAGFCVYGVDIVARPGNPALFKQADVRDIKGDELPRMAWIHASPPCTRFSLARCNRGTDPPTDADLDLLRAALRVIRENKPLFWSVENVRGARPFFEKEMGRPAFHHGPFWFWGNFPAFLVERSGLKKGIYGSKSPTTARLGKQTKPKDPWASAELPIELTRPMARAVASAIEAGGDR